MLSSFIKKMDELTDSLNKEAENLNNSRDERISKNIIDQVTYRYNQHLKDAVAAMLQMKQMEQMEQDFPEFEQFFKKAREARF